LTELEEGGLQAWIAHAAAAMVQLKAYIWSLNTSANPYFMRSDLISTANGMCNGYLYGFRVRSERKLLPCLRNATEDRERSVRYFAADGVVLRYKMYTATTKCFKNAGGLQDDWQGTMAERNNARKIHEREGHRLIEAAFPGLYAAKPEKVRRSVESMEGSFRRVRSSQVPCGLWPDMRPRVCGDGRPKRRGVRRQGARAEASPVAVPSMAPHLKPSQRPSSNSSSSLSVRVEETESWECGCCSCINGPIALACSACGSLRPITIGAGDWMCCQCTALNTALTLACLLCMTVKPADHSWLCLRCQTHSPAEDEHCVDCGLATKDNKPGTFMVYIDSDSDEEGSSGDEADVQDGGRPTWWCGTKWTPIKQEQQQPVDRTRLMTAADCLAAAEEGGSPPTACPSRKRQQFASMVPREVTAADGPPSAHTQRRVCQYSSSSSSSSSSALPARGATAAPPSTLPPGSEDSDGRDCPAADAVWRCTACSFDNPKAHAPICEICGALRDLGDNI